MTRILTIFCFLISTIAFSQKNELIVTERGENPILMGNVSIDLPITLIVGHEYQFDVLTSHQHDVKLNYTNATVEFDESSLKNTGPLRYFVTPKAPGELRLTVGVGLPDGKGVSLLARYYKVSNPPTPVIYLARVPSGSVLSNLGGSFDLKCSSPSSFRVDDNYEIKKWSVKLGSKTYMGSGNVLSEEVSQIIRKSADRELLYLEIELEENNADFNKAEGVYIIGKE